MVEGAAHGFVLAWGRDKVRPMNLALKHPRTTRAAEGLPRWRFTVADVEAMVVAGILDEDETGRTYRGGVGPHVAQGQPARGVENRAQPPVAARLPRRPTDRPRNDVSLVRRHLSGAGFCGLPRRRRSDGHQGRKRAARCRGRRHFAALRPGSQGAALCAIRHPRAMVSRRRQDDDARVPRPQAPEATRPRATSRRLETVEPLFAPKELALRLDRLKLV